MIWVLLVALMLGSSLLFCLAAPHIALAWLAAPAQLIVFIWRKGYEWRRRN